MTDSEFSERKVRQCWDRNAGAWTRAIDEGTIASRRLVTDEAIVAALLETRPHRVLDAGCGEGWLGRALAAEQVKVCGIDASSALVETARRRAGPREDYRHLSYCALRKAFADARFDVVACNFSLLGRDSVNTLFTAMRVLLRPGGQLVVQTLHPLVSCETGQYRDGWRHESWDGFGDDFSGPCPWYFRTIGSWIGLFRDNGFTIRELREPMHPETGQPASLILIGSREN